MTIPLSLTACLHSFHGFNGLYFHSLMKLAAELLIFTSILLLVILRVTNLFIRTLYM